MGLRKLNIFEKIVSWFRYLFIGGKKAKDNSDEAKREMCKRAVQGGVCPHTCDTCAWNTLR